MRIWGCRVLCGSLALAFFFLFSFFFLGVNYSPPRLKFLLRRRAFTLYSRTCRRWWARRVEAATLIDCERWSGWSVDGEDGEATHGGNPSRLLPCSRTGGLNWDNRVRGILKSLEFDHAPRCHATAWKTIQREGRGGEGRSTWGWGGEEKKRKRERERVRERGLFICIATRPILTALVPVKCGRRSARRKLECQWVSSDYVPRVTCLTWITRNWRLHTSVC